MATSYPNNICPSEYKTLCPLDVDEVSVCYDAIHIATGTRTILHVGYLHKMVSHWDQYGITTAIPTEVNVIAKFCEMSRGIPRVFGYGRVSSNVVYY